MSFIVKGAEMPKTCLDCPLADVEQGWCSNDMVTIIDFNELPAECPLVPLPDKHGRLVDADAIVNAMNDMKVEGEVFVTAVNYVKLIMNDADTIVEAEDTP